MSPTHSYHFIEDLIPSILYSNDHWWPQDLIRLAAVSPGWLFHIRKRLYSSPALYSFRSCSLLSRTLTENPSLLSLLKGIDLRPMVTNTYDLDYALSAKDIASLRFILGIQGLRSIALGGHLAVHAERFLNALGDPEAVTDIHVDGSLLRDAIASCPSLEWDENMMLKFSNLKNLHLTRIELDIIPPSIPSTLSLTNLILDNVDIINGYLPNLMYGIPTLNHLYVRTKASAQFDEHIKLLLESCAVNSLHYEVREGVRSEGSIFSPDSPSSRSLRHLHLKGMHVDPDTLVSIQQHYPNLQELVVSGRRVQITPLDWISFINSRTLPALKQLGISWGTNHPPFVRWTDCAAEPLLEAAASQDVNVISC